MLLNLTPSHLQTLQFHAEQAYPNECCGLLLGTQSTEPHTVSKNVWEIYPTPNAWNSEDPDANAFVPADTTTRRRYRIDPKAMLAAQQYARTKAWDIIGIYHSHPDQMAVPSEWDRTWAWPQYSYVIVAVENGIARDVRSWALDNCHEFLPEKLEMAGATPPQVVPNPEDKILEAIALLKDNDHAQSEPG